MNKGIAVYAKQSDAAHWSLVSPRYATRSMSHAQRIADMYTNEWGWQAMICRDNREPIKLEPTVPITHLTSSEERNAGTGESMPASWVSP